MSSAFAQSRTYRLIVALSLLIFQVQVLAGDWLPCLHLGDGLSGSGGCEMHHPAHGAAHSDAARALQTHDRPLLQGRFSLDPQQMASDPAEDCQKCQLELCSAHWLGLLQTMPSLIAEHAHPLVHRSTMDPIRLDLPPWIEPPRSHLRS